MVRLLNHQEADRVGILDGFWVETIDRWKKEGFPESATPADYFEHDIAFVMFESRMGFREEVISEDADFKILRNIDGVIFRIPKDKRHFVENDIDMPGIPVDYLMKDRHDWEKYRHLFKPDDWRIAYKPDITPPFYSTKADLKALKEHYASNRERNRFIFFAPREPFEGARGKLGTENLLYLMAADKEFIRELFESEVDMVLDMYERFLKKGFEFDGLWAWGDICYNTGMMFSPALYRDLLMPAHKRLFGYFRDRGMHVMYHCDGNMNEVLPLLMGSGITAIQPLEVKAGNDIFKMKDQYGSRITLMGNMDVRVFAVTKEEIETEIKSKIIYAMRAGGYLYHSDHSIPPEVSFENYRFVMDCVKKFGSYK